VLFKLPQSQMTHKSFYKKFAGILLAAAFQLLLYCWNLIAGLSLSADFINLVFKLDTGSSLCRNWRRNAWQK